MDDRIGTMMIGFNFEGLNDLLQAGSLHREVLRGTLLSP